MTSSPNPPPPQSSQLSPNLAMELEAKQLLTDLFEPQKREQALLHLSRMKETIPDLAILLWKTPCIIALLIQEIIKIYPYLSPPTLSSGDSTRVCYALSLFQCIASEPSLRSKLLNAQVLHYIYPLLSTSTSLLEFEHLRITSLGVIGSILKGGTDVEIIVHLLENKFVPLCLHSIDKGTQASKAVATFILEKILITDIGLRYVCCTADRFFCIHQILKSMVASSHEKPSVRLLRHVIRCYLRLSHHTRAREVLRHELPAALKDGTFNELLQVEDLTRVALVQLLDNTGNQCFDGEPVDAIEKVDRA